VLFVCGDGSRMSPDVERTMAECYCEAHGVPAAQGDAWVAELQRNKRYVQDVWAS
jgi:cytochrome P450 / NADPH-cytochrome P450 reductase